MKTVTYILTCTFLCFFLYSFAGDVPAAVKSAFKAKYPSIEKVKWEKEGAGEYEAEFTMNGTEMSVNFNEAGTIIETETEIEKSQLPVAIAEAFKKDYSRKKIKEVSKIEKGDGKVIYEVEYSCCFFCSKEAFYDSSGNRMK
jgi:hypothetical protein